MMNINPLLKRIAHELNEQFSQWSYTLPKDPEQILYDFYFLSNFAGSRETGNEDLDYALEEAVKSATDALQKHMLKAVKWSLSCEMRHLFDYSDWGGDPYDEEDMADNRIKWSPKTIEFVKAYGRYLGALRPKGELKKEIPHYKFVKNKKTGKKKKVLSHTEKVYGKVKPTLQKPIKVTKRLTGPLSRQRPPSMSERTESYKAVNSALKTLKYSPQDFGQVAYEIFNAPIWGSSGGFGGKSWARIAKGWTNLLNADSLSAKFTWIDHVYDLQHNSDTVFDKVKSYYKSETRSDEYGDEDEVGFSWLADALDWKRDVKDIREYYDLVSTNLKPVVAYVSKQRYQKTMEDPLERTHKPTQKNWEGGHWPGGKWEGGIWEDGIWEKGTWKTGTWKDGTWKDGIWQDGTWEDGTWEGGTWKSGEWRDGFWKDGTWKDGEWGGGRIWSKKFNKYVKSDEDPREFYRYEKSAKSIKDLKDKLGYGDY